MVRELDPQGRICLPRELRDTMDIPSGAPLAVYEDGNTIILKKYEPGCIFCGESKEGMIQLKGKSVCPDCRPSSLTCEFIEFYKQHDKKEQAGSI